MQGTESWRFMNRGKPILRHPRGRFKADNGEALLVAALAGLGVAGLPDFLIEPHVASGALAPVLTDYPPPDAGLYVVRPPGDLPRKVRVLTDIRDRRPRRSKPGYGRWIVSHHQTGYLFAISLSVASNSIICQILSVTESVCA